ncbi:carboxylate-amine ligase [Aestuariibius sp. HNIBRBA575]|uniref:carboxylate-amine ligase n=1 Tax=Aestuariibius sp. HNIBRBA575 TaxID=3233343 RepID=UPI0034A2BC38
MTEPSFTIGVEEEYLLVDTSTFELVKTPTKLMEEAEAELGGQVSPEYLQCQIEIGTKVCSGTQQARDELRRLRSVIATVAMRHGLAPIAASCHPFADWKDQPHTDKVRYNQLRQDLGGVVRRMLICGMHVHVGLESQALRIDLMNQMSYFLPHLLALSTSSPFWQGEDTGLASYRLSIFDNLPRTGLPPRIDSWGEYERSVHALTDVGVIEDSSKIWWDLRPSAQYPTLETRICDVQPRLNHTLSLAAAIQCLSRMLYRLRVNNQRWRTYENFLISENRWRAQRYGISNGLIDFGRGEIVQVSDLVDELIEMLMQDAEALDCVDDLIGLRDIVENGNSADRQRQVAHKAQDQGKSQSDQMRMVVSHLIQEFSTDL